MQLNWRRRIAARRPVRGLSLVELMVGIAVGLMVVAGASFVAVNQIGDNRRLTLETQVQQDLRAAADMIARDLRRSGYWGNSQQGLWQGSSPAAASNPYTLVELAAGQITFRYSRDVVEDNSVDVDNETFGFKLDGGAIKMRIGGTWQQLTDPTVLQVTGFTVTPPPPPPPQPQSVQQACYKECPGGSSACPPKLEIRRYDIEITGHAVSDSSVERSVRESVRLRNDLPSGACPA